MLSVWEERKDRLYGEHSNVSQNDSGDLRGVTGGDGELGCLYGKAGTSHLCDGSAHSSCYSHLLIYTCTHIHLTPSHPHRRHHSQLPGRRETGSRLQLHLDRDL